MSIGAGLLPEFDQEMAGTRRVLENLPDDKLDWKAHEKSNTIGWVANHLAEIPGWTQMTLSTDSLDVNPPDGPKYQTAKLESQAEILAEFDKNVAAARAALGNTEDAEFFKGGAGGKGGRGEAERGRGSVNRPPGHLCVRPRWGRVGPAGGGGGAGHGGPLLTTVPSHMGSSLTFKTYGHRTKGGKGRKKRGRGGGGGEGKEEKGGEEGEREGRGKRGPVGGRGGGRRGRGGGGGEGKDEGGERGEGRKGEEGGKKRGGKRGGRRGWSDLGGGGRKEGEGRKGGEGRRRGERGERGRERGGGGGEEGRPLGRGCAARHKRNG